MLRLGIVPGICPTVEHTFSATHAQLSRKLRKSYVMMPSIPWHRNSVYSFHHLQSLAIGQNLWDKKLELAWVLTRFSPTCVETFTDHCKTAHTVLQIHIGARPSRKSGSKWDTVLYLQRTKRYSILYCRQTGSSPVTYSTMSSLGRTELKEHTHTKKNFSTCKVADSRYPQSVHTVVWATTAPRMCNVMGES